MYKGESRVLPAILVIIVTIVAIIALVSLGRLILSRTAANRPVVDDGAVKALLTTNADRSVRMMVRGPITADEDFRSYVIEVSPTSRRMTTYSGYENRELDSKQFTNNTEAYAEFVAALNRANFTKGIEPIDTEENMRGICAGGRFYTFEMAQSQSVSQQFWTTSCRNSNGTFRGDAPGIRTLFLRQIPGSDAMLQSIDL